MNEAAPVAAIIAACGAAPRVVASAREGEVG
jgi:hypothetical protein